MNSKKPSNGFPRAKQQARSYDNRPRPSSRSNHSGLNYSPESPSICLNAHTPIWTQRGLNLTPTTAVTTVQVTQYCTTYSTSFQPLGADGASSFIETKSTSSPKNPSPSTRFSTTTSAGQPNVAHPKLDKPAKVHTLAPSKRPIPRNQTLAPNRKPINYSQPRKTRLPWLDGSQGRRGSMPSVPGAFVEESPVSKSASKMLPSTPGQLIMERSKVLDKMDKPHATGPPDTSLPLPKLATESPTQSIEPSSSVLPARQEPFSRDKPPDSKSEASVDVKKESDSQRSIEHSLPKPQPVPLLSMARDLYQTDSSAFSDSEISMKGDRRRALAESAIPIKSEKKVAPIQTHDESHQLADQPSPRDLADTTPASSLVAEEMQTLSPPADRKLSMNIQPVRQKRVTMTVDDLPTEKSDRQRSISVQPIRSRSLSSIETAKDPNARSSNTISVTKPVTNQLDNIQNSITGLESLMKEAMQLAREAAENDRSDQVPEILNEARFALHRASIVQNKQRTGIEPVGIGSSVSSDCSSCFSQSTTSPTDTLQPFSMLSPAVRCSVGHSKRVNQRPGMNARTLSAGPQAVWDEDWQNRTIDVSPRSIDWAYAQRPPLARGTSAINGPNAMPEHPTVTLKSYSARIKPQDQRIEITAPLPTKDLVKDYIVQHNEPPYFPRSSSLKYANAALEGANSPSPNSNERDRSPSPPPERGRERVPTLTNTAENWGRDKFDEKDYVKTSDNLKGKHHITLKQGEHFSIHHGHRRQPIARNWSTSRKRFTAIIACLNTALVGILIGIYAGEVPAIQYSLADTRHLVIMGNVWLYIGMAITTFIFWPLPLLHGRKPYTLLSLGIALPLQIPQAMIVAEKRSIVNDYTGYVVGMLVSRGVLGLVLGFAHINFKATLLDLYGSSLQSEFPHGEVVIVDDVRRHGGGMGYWLGIWSFSFIGSLALGFLVGADVVSGLNLSWGFYICVILIALMLFLNVITPETRRSPHRRTMQEVELPNDSVSRRVARGEVRMHVSGDGPKWWWEEVFAGVYLNLRMLIQSGFLVMALYLAWIYAEIVLIIVLLGNLLSAQYSWRPEYVGLGVLAIAIGALLAVPNSKANFFSRSRIQGPRTDSMTFQPRFTWTSHMVRRALFMTTLPVAGLAYTLASKGTTISYMAPIVFAGLIGYVSNLAIAECNGIIMENFDTSDLQPGTNSKHRLQSLAPSTRRRRTTYSSYPRVSAGIFSAQSIGFLFAAAATGVGGAVTRTVGAQKTTAITAGILMGLTILLTLVLFRFRVVQVIPNELFATTFSLTGGERKKSTASIDSDKSWRAVVIGSPSGKNRRMNWLELGSLSRWTEIRRLNRLLSRTTTQALNPGWK